MRVRIHAELEKNAVYGENRGEMPSGTMECGPGGQRVAWVARVAAQRFGSEGCWCTNANDKVGRPAEYIPGRIFIHDSGQEIDPDSTLASVLQSLSKDGDMGEVMMHDAHISFRIQLWATPAKGIPTLSAFGSEDAIVAPKNIQQAKLYIVPKKQADDLGRALTCLRTPAPSPPEYKGYVWEDVKDRIDFSDLTQDADHMIVAATFNVLSNNFAALIDIFLHYSHEHKDVLDLSGQTRIKKKMDPNAQVEEEAPKPQVITHIGMAKLAQVCGLSSAKCSMLDLQRASLHPELFLANDPERPHGLPYFTFEYELPHFLEALVRIAYLKNYALMAVCDRVNRLVHTQILPLAGASVPTDFISTVLEKPYPCFEKHKDALQKWYIRTSKFEKTVGARSVSLSTFIKMLEISEQLSADLDPPAVCIAWAQTLTFEAPVNVDENDTELEVTLSQMQQIFLRCAITKAQLKLEELVWGSGAQSSGEASVDRAGDSFIKHFFKKHDKP